MKNKPGKVTVLLLLVIPQDNLGHFGGKQNIVNKQAEPGPRNTDRHTLSTQTGREQTPLFAICETLVKPGV